MAFSLFSTDNTTDKIYRHDGFSASILDSFSSPAANPRGVTWDGANIVSADYTTTKIYKHFGFSVTVLDSFSSPNPYPVGLTWDGVNVCSADAGSTKIYRHDGFSASILDSFSSPSTNLRGITWDGSNVYSSDSGTDKIYKHDGFSASILDSFSSPSVVPLGLTYIPSNIYSIDSVTDKIYRHLGFSFTIADSFSSPSNDPFGLSWDGVTLFDTDVDSGIAGKQKSSVDSGVWGISTEETGTDSGVNGKQHTPVDSGVPGLPELSAHSAIRGVVEDLTINILSGIRGVQTKETDAESGISGLAEAIASSGIAGLSSLKINSGIIGGTVDVFGFSYPLTDPIPLRNTTIWGSFKNVQTIPHVYGRVRLAPIPYDDAGKLFVLADHGIQGVDEVQIDDEAIYAWKFKNTLDSSDSPVAMLELTENLSSGSSLIALVRGKAHSVTGTLLVNPADVLWDILANIVGASVTYATLDKFRVECAFYGIEIGGLLDDRERSIKKQLDLITESIGAIWSGGMPGLARIYPVDN